MTSGLFSIFAIVSVALLIFLAIVIYVFRSVLIRSRRAKADIRAAFPDLIDAGFQFESPASLFAPVLSGYVPNGTGVSFHFRIPGRGFTGRLPYDGVQVWMVQLAGGIGGKQNVLVKKLEDLGGRIAFQSDSRIQCQLTDARSVDLSALLRELAKEADPKL